VDSVPDRLLLRKSGSAGNLNRDLWPIYAKIRIDKDGATAKTYVSYAGVSVSNLGQRRDVFFCGFLKPFQENPCVVVSIRPRPHASKSFTMHYPFSQSY
jgi:hypothetical protein